MTPLTQKPTAPPLRIGVIGLGWVARACHLPALDHLRRAGCAAVRVTALADPTLAGGDAARAALPGLFGPEVRTFADGEALLRAAPRDLCDALLLLTPPAATAALLPRAFDADLPTFAEKPVAEDAETLAALTEQAGRPGTPPVLVGYNRRWQPLAPAFREEVLRLRSSPGTLHFEARLWRADRAEPIFYRDTMVHALDFLLWVLGPLEVRRVSVWPPTLPGAALPAGLRAEMTTVDGTTTAHVDVRPAAGRNRESYEAIGASAAAELVYPPADRGAVDAARLSIWSRDGSVQESPTPHAPEGGDPILQARGFVGQMEEFLGLAAAHRAGAGPASPCDIRDALAARRLADAVLAAARDAADAAAGTTWA